MLVASEEDIIMNYQQLPRIKLLMKRQKKIEFPRCYMYKAHM